MDWWVWLLLAVALALGTLLGLMLTAIVSDVRWRLLKRRDPQEYYRRSNEWLRNHPQ